MHGPSTTRFLTLIPAWISSYVHYKLWAWNHLSNPFPNDNGATIYVWEFTSDFISHFTEARRTDIIIWTCLPVWRWLIIILRYSGAILDLHWHRMGKRLILKSCQVWKQWDLYNHYEGCQATRQWFWAPVKFQNEFNTQSCGFETSRYLVIRPLNE